jgi:hypothetical protein
MLRLSHFEVEREVERLEEQSAWGNSDQIEYRKKAENRES